MTLNFAVSQVFWNIDLLCSSGCSQTPEMSHLCYNQIIPTFTRKYFNWTLFILAACVVGFPSFVCDLNERPEGSRLWRIKCTDGG